MTLADGRQVESAVVSRLDAITALQGSARDLSIVQAEVSDLGSAQTNLDTLAGVFATRITSFNSDVRDFVDAVKRADGVLNATEKSKLKDIANDYSNALKTTATSMIAVTTGAAKALGAAGDALVSADAAKKSARNAMAFSVLGTIAAVAWAGLSFNWVGRAQTGSFRNLFLTLGNSAGAAKTTMAVGVLASGIFLASGVKTSLENAKTLKQSAILPSFSSNDTEISNGKDAMGDLKKLMDKNNLSFNGFSNSSQKFFSIAEDVAVENFLMTMLLDLTDDNGGGPPYTKVNDYRKTMVDLGFSVEGSSKQTIVGQKNVGTQSKELGFSNTLKNVTASDGQIVSIGTPGFIAHSGVPTEYGNNIRYFDDFVWSASTYMKVLWP